MQGSLPTTAGVNGFSRIEATTSFWATKHTSRLEAHLGTVLTLYGVCSVFHVYLTVPFGMPIMTGVHVWYHKIYSVIWLVGKALALSYAILDPSRLPALLVLLIPNCSINHANSLAFCLLMYDLKNPGTNNLPYLVSSLSSFLCSGTHSSTRLRGSLPMCRTWCV